MMTKPELLCPAGDMERLEMALHYGADAVYLAGEQFGMRAAAGNFSEEELCRAVKLAHQNGITVHITSIISFRFLWRIEMGSRNI